MKNSVRGRLVPRRGNPDERAQKGVERQDRSTDLRDVGPAPQRCDGRVERADCGNCNQRALLENVVYLVSHRLPFDESGGS